MDTQGRWEKTGELSRARESDACSRLRTQDSNVLTAQDTAHVFGSRKVEIEMWWSRSEGRVGGG